jgi:hypothetical protein
MGLTYGAEVQRVLFVLSTLGLLLQTKCVSLSHFRSSDGQQGTGPPARHRSTYSCFDTLLVVTLVWSVFVRVHVRVCTRACSKLQGTFNKHGSSPPPHIWVNKAFYSSVAGSTFSRNNMQQIAKESVSCYSRNKMMHSGNNTGNLVLWEALFLLSLMWCTKFHSHTKQAKM